MEVHELYGLDGACSATGHVVVIDVLRAFTCAAHVLAGGPAELLLAGTIEEALALKRDRPGALLIGIGRRDERHLFDVGNSPHELSQLDLRGRIVIQRTGNGTRGVAAAERADAVYAAALVNAGATARHLTAIGAERVSLVAMGGPPGPDGPEDIACRDLLASFLRGEQPTESELAAVRRRVVECPAADELRDPAAGIGCPEDVELAAEIDRFAFAMEVRREHGVRRVRPVAAAAPKDRGS